MTAIELLIDKLKAMNADGLCTYGCGCSIDDLAPCEHYFGDCVPSKKIETPSDSEFFGEYDNIFIPIEEFARNSKLLGSAPDIEEYQND